MNKEYVEDTYQLLAEIKRAHIALDEFLSNQNIHVLAWPPALVRAFVRLCVELGLKKEKFSRLLKECEKTFDRAREILEENDE